MLHNTTVCLIKFFGHFEFFRISLKKNEQLANFKQS
jgi:hypothetical protein